MATFPPSFWEWYEDDYDHNSSTSQEERGRDHGFLPSSLLEEGRGGFLLEEG